jgi:hypothetical protein
VCFLLATLLTGALSFGRGVKKIGRQPGAQKLGRQSDVGGYLSIQFAITKKLACCKFKQSF